MGRKSHSKAVPHGFLIWRNIHEGFGGSVCEACTVGEEGQSKHLEVMGWEPEQRLKRWGEGTEAQGQN